MMNAEQLEILVYLRSCQAIREQSNYLFELACQEKLQNFQIDLTLLEKTADFVLDVINEHYPDGVIPFHSRWRHLEAVNQDKMKSFNQSLSSLSSLERTQVKFDLIIVSVLLDAGAGSQWCYEDQETGKIYQRSEGLALGSWQMFCQGIFSNNPDFPYQVNAHALRSLTVETLSHGLQVSHTNPLLGLEERVKLLQNLGQVLEELPLFFGGGDNPRPGALVQHFLATRFSGLTTISAPEILSTLVKVFGNIWLEGTTIYGVKLGDVWSHPALEQSPRKIPYIPFHKLSLWLTYSLLEPLEEMGLTVVDLEELPGLAEYRNGGLCLDLGLIKVRDPLILTSPHELDSEVIIEWRALTIILLEKIAETLRQKLGKNSQELPLTKILQGGTWSGGRKIALQLRKEGIPPLQITRYGTVF